MVMPVANNCSDATIAALCCVYGDYVSFGNLKTNDPDICGLPSGQILISAVVVSVSGPWGYDAITQTLTIPDNSNLLTNGPVWQWNSANQTMEMRFIEIDGTAYYLQTNSVGTTAQKSMSFQDNGVGIELIHSDETSGVLPASPSDIPNAVGTTNRKFKDHQYYLWFNNDHGRFTHWWNPANSTWRVIRQNRNVLIVHPSGGGNRPEYATLSSAYTYLTSLPVSPAAGDPNQDARPSISNRWSVIIYGRITETAQIEARDFIDVFFMPGGQLYCTASIGPGVLFDGTSAIRANANEFAASWTSVGASFSSAANDRTANIVRLPLNNTGTSSCIKINAMSSMNLSNLSLYFADGSSNHNHWGIEVTGNCQGTNIYREGVYLWRICVVMNAVANNTWPYFRAVLACNHSAGNVYAEDCIFMYTPQSNGLGEGVMNSDISSAAYLHLNECFVNASREGASHALWAQLGMTLVTNSTFEAYGNLTNGFGSAALNLNGNIQAFKCIFRIVQAGTISGSPNAQTIGMIASSCCVYGQIPDGESARFDDCAFYGETAVATGITLAPNGTWADTKLVMTGCVVRAQLASIASLMATTGNTKKIYRTHLEGPISGTPFGCAGATTAYGTSFLI
jgi:hypothetical protein